MGLWCIMAAPLIMSNDLRNIRPEFKQILQNKEAIKINQDPLGVQGKRVYKENDIEIFTKPILPSYQGKTSVAVVVLNRWAEGTPIRVKVPLTKLGIDHMGGYSARDVFEGTSMGILSPDDVLQVDVNPTGIVMVRLDVLPGIMYRPHVDSGHQDEVEVVKHGLTGWCT